MPRRTTLLLLALLLTAPLTVLGQTGEAPPPPAPSEGPPAEAAPPSEAAPPPETAPPKAAPAPVHHKKKAVKHRRRHAKAGAPQVETTVEPASARLAVTSPGAPIYARAIRSSEQVGTLSADKYVQVTGSTRSFLQVQLKDGRVGYIQPSSVQLVTPYDKQFLLTADSPVYASPNQFGSKVAEVHRGRYIHVVGESLSYLKIRMKDGTEGFVPMTAAQ
jgi:hypothetical protein